MRGWAPILVLVAACAPRTNHTLDPPADARAVFEYLAIDGVPEYLRGHDLSQAFSASTNAGSELFVVYTRESLDRFRVESGDHPLGVPPTAPPFADGRRVEFVAAFAQTSGRPLEPIEISALPEPFSRLRAIREEAACVENGGCFPAQSTVCEPCESPRPPQIAPEEEIEPRALTDADCHGWAVTRVTVPELNGADRTFCDPQGLLGTVTATTVVTLPTARPLSEVTITGDRSSIRDASIEDSIVLAPLQTEGEVRIERSDVREPIRVEGTLEIRDSRIFAAAVAEGATLRLLNTEVTGTITSSGTVTATTVLFTRTSTLNWAFFQAGGQANMNVARFEGGGNGILGHDEAKLRLRAVSFFDLADTAIGLQDSDAEARQLLFHGSSYPSLLQSIRSSFSRLAVEDATSIYAFNHALYLFRARPDSRLERLSIVGRRRDKEKRDGLRVEESVGVEVDGVQAADLSLRAVAFIRSEGALRRVYARGSEGCALVEGGTATVDQLDCQDSIGPGLIGLRNGDISATNVRIAKLKSAPCPTIGLCATGVLVSSSPFSMSRFEISLAPDSGVRAEVVEGVELADGRITVATDGVGIQVCEDGDIHPFFDRVLIEADDGQHVGEVCVYDFD